MQPYEIDDDVTERLPWRFLTMVALVLWIGAWWLGKQ